MKKIIKILGFVFAGGILLIAALAAAVRIFLPPEKAKALLEEQISAHLGREARLGSVSVGLFRGVRVTEFALSEPPRFADGVFVSSEELRVRVSLLPLLRRVVLVRDFRLVKPAVNIIRFADGRFNFSDLIPEDEATTDPSETPAQTDPDGGFSVIVTGASIRNGTLTFDDRTPDGHSVRVEPFNIALRNLSLAGTADVDADLAARVGELDGTLDFAGTVNVFKGSAAIRRLALKSGDAAITVSGDARDLTTEPVFDLAVEIKDLDPAAFASLITFPDTLRLSGPMAGKVSASGTTGDIAFHASLDLTGQTVASPGTFTKPAKTPMTVEAAGRLTDLDALSLESARIQLSTLEAAATGQITAVLTSTPTIRLTLKTNAFPVMDVLTMLEDSPLPEDLSLSGNASLAADIAGTPDAGRIAFDVNGAALAIRSGDMFDKPAGTALGVRGSGRYRMPLDVNLADLALTLGPARFAGEARYRDTDKGAAYSASLKTNAFPLAEVAGMAPPARAYSPSGTATLSVTVSANAGADPQIKGALTLKDGGARYEASELSALAAAIAFTETSVTIPSLTGNLNDAPLTIKLDAKNLQKHPAVSADIRVAALDLERLLPKDTAPAGSQPGGSGGAASAPTGPTGGTRETGPAATAGGTTNDSAQTAGAQATAAQRSSAPSAAPAEPQLPMDLRGTLRVEKITHPFLNAQDLTATWNLTDVTADLERVNGAATLKQGKGEFRNIQKLTEESRAARIVFLPLTLLQRLEKSTGGRLKLPAMDRVAFSSITGDYAFEKGVMRINSFSMNADVMDASMNGTVGLSGEQRLNLKATLVLPEGAVASAVGQLLPDGTGRASLGLNVTGTVSDPNVGVDVRDAGRRVLDAIKSGGADGLLRRIGLPGVGTPAPKPQDAPAPTDAAPGTPAAPSQSAPADTAPAQPAPPAEEKKPDLADDVQNLLRGILKRK